MQATACVRVSSKAQNHATQRAAIERAAAARGDTIKRAGAKSTPSDRPAATHPARVHDGAPSADSTVADHVPPCLALSRALRRRHVPKMQTRSHRGGGETHPLGARIVQKLGVCPRQPVTVGPARAARRRSAAFPPCALRPNPRAGILFRDRVTRAVGVLSTRSLWSHAPANAISLSGPHGGYH